MSRNIPPVRQWRVRFYAGDKIVAQATIETINKWFARQMANEQLGYVWQRWADRCTVSLVPQNRKA